MALAASATHYMVEIIQRAIKRFGRDALTFKLHGPEKITMRRPSRVPGEPHSYTKHPFIGDEEFLLTECYMGKSGKAICVFMQEGMAAITVEIPFADCPPKLKGFSTFVSAASILRDDDVVGEAKAEAEEKERLAHLAAQQHRQIENPNFGSW